MAMRTLANWLLISVIILTSCSALAAGETIQDNASEQCMLEAIHSGKFEHLTIAELRRACSTLTGRAELAQNLKVLSPAEQIAATGSTTEEELAPGPLQQRLDDEQQTQYLPFSLTSHRRNYLLPVTYRSSTNGPPLNVEDEEIDNIEVKFQFSFKFPVWNNILGNADLWGAYTNISFWQAYNSKHSSPFRETNHEPELFLEFSGYKDILGFSNTRNHLGIVHQSNGRHGSLSRSWNRVYLDIALEHENLVLNIKPWWRIPESEKSSADDTSGDDNPNIEKYFGYGEITAGYKWQQQLFSVMLRNNLRANGNKGAVQLDWTFPMTRRLKGYIQYFNGYGESLIDYDCSVNRIGIGIVLTDPL
jgi:phospholipase A1